MDIGIISIAGFSIFAFVSGLILLYTRKDHLESLSVSPLPEGMERIEVLNANLGKNQSLKYFRTALDLLEVLFAVAILYTHGPLKGLIIILILISINNALTYAYVLLNSILGSILPYSKMEFASAITSQVEPEYEEYLSPKLNPRRNTELLFSTLLNIILIVLCTKILFTYNPLPGVTLSGIFWMIQNLLILFLCRGNLLS